MNKFFKIFIISIFIIGQNHSQELVEISMGSGYEYDIYYSFDDGITAFPQRENWELAFSTNQYDNNIRINSSYVNLYQVSENIQEWEDITSFNSSTAIQLRNSNTEWEIGAFVSNYFDKNPLNYGWGNYNTENQQIEGCRIYIIDYNGQMKKIKINNLSNGIYNFTIANLDGSNEENISIDSNPYTNKKFIYYSLINNEILDREPDSANWDFVFTRYEEDLNNNPNNPLYYKVTGVLSNENLVSEYNGPLDINPSTENMDISNEINTIGYDWKEYTGEFVMTPNRAYYLFSQDQTSLYKIIFQSFSGQGSGNVSFTIEEIQDFNPVNNINNIEENIIQIYPNPNKGRFYIDLNGKQGILSIIDTHGKIVLKKELNQSLTLNLDNLSKGLFLINLKGDNFNVSKKMLIK